MKGVRFVPALIMLAGVNAAAEPPRFTPIANVYARHTVSLDGKWRTIVDPYENGYYDFRLAAGGAGYFRDAKPKDKSDLVEYNFDTRPNSMCPATGTRSGQPVLLRRHRLVSHEVRLCEASRARALFVYFGAANYQAIVYLNGKKLGTHVGGFTPFEFEITDRRRRQGNFIVKVDDQRHATASPRSTPTGGITAD